MSSTNSWDGYIENKYNILRDTQQNEKIYLIIAAAREVLTKCNLKKPDFLRVAFYWNRVPREADKPSLLETFKTWQDKTLSSLLYLGDYSYFRQGVGLEEF